MNRLLASLLLALFLPVSRAAEAAPVAAPAAPATFLFVHGAWGGGWQWKKVGALLSADGYTVYRPTLTGLGERVHLASPDINLTTHINDIVNFIVWEDLHDLVLVGHSYGGMVITGVMERVPERIRQVIFLDAIVPNDGESLNDAMGPVPELRQAVDGFIPASWVKPGHPIPYDVPHPAKTLSEPVSYKNPAALKLPATFLLDVAPGQKLRDARFYKFYGRAQARGWNLVTMEADHNPEWFKPKELTALLEKIVAAPERKNKTAGAPFFPVEKPRPQFSEPGN